MSGIQTKSEFVSNFNASCPARSVLESCPARLVLSNCPAKALGSTADFVKNFKDNCPAKALGSTAEFVKNFKSTTPVQDSKTWLSSQKMFAGAAPSSEQNAQSNLDYARFICEYQNQSRAGRKAILDNMKETQKQDKEKAKQARKFYTGQSPQGKKQLLQLAREENKQSKQDWKDRRKALNASGHRLNGKYQYAIDT